MPDMHPGIQLQLGQQQTLSPQLQLSLKLLQLTSPELVEEIELALADNPFLEKAEADESNVSPTLYQSSPRLQEEKSDTYEAYAQTLAPSVSDSGVSSLDKMYDWGRTSATSDDDVSPLDFASATLTLRDHLLQQLGCLSLTDTEHLLILCLIDELDENGLLAQPLSELIVAIPAEFSNFPSVTPDEWQTALSRLQAMDPPGIGATCTIESLCLQIKARYLEGKITDTLATLTTTLLSSYLPLVAKRDIPTLAHNTGSAIADINAAYELISSLNPRPAAPFINTPTHYVLPDIIVEKHQGLWMAKLNPAVLPDVILNSELTNALQTLSKDAARNANTKLNEARMFLYGLEARYDTLRRTANAIVQRQQSFFENGDTALKPMVLRDIAQELNLHESTISRATLGKYLQCPRGIFELKHFFTSSITTEEGGTTSSRAIRAHICAMIASENPSKPLSDSTIVEKLEKLGFVVARRTVAKYREMEALPAVSLRRRR